MINTPEQAQKPTGELSIRFEPPDLLLVTAVGEVTPEIISAAYDEIAGIGVARGRLFLIADTSRLMTVPLSARKSVVDHAKQARFRGTAVVGASARVRAILSFLFRALELVGDRFRRTPVRFFSTEAEARAWIAARRLATNQA